MREGGWRESTIQSGVTLIRKDAKLPIMGLLIGIPCFPYKYEVAYHSRKLCLVTHIEKATLIFNISVIRRRMEL